MAFGFRFLKPKKDVKQVNDWLKLQSHPEDALTYLIEKEIFENGMRDLSYHIPRLRNDEYFKSLQVKEPVGKSQEAKSEPTVSISAPTLFDFNTDQKVAATSDGGEVAQRKNRYVSNRQEVVSDTPQMLYKASGNANPIVLPNNSMDLTSVDTACYDD